MNTQKHTPAPWTFSESGTAKNPTQSHIAWVDYGAIIADVPNGSISPDEIKANAKLIAAAPELLSICLSILKDDEQEGTLLPLDRVKLKNAIHNATV